MQFIPYNSRDIRHKSVFGSVAEKEQIRFSILMPRSFSCSAAYLVLHLGGEKECSYPLYWNGMNGDSEEWWGTDYTFDKAGLYYYHFEYDTPFGRGGIHLRSSGMGAFSFLPCEWQQTVYKADFTVPEWVGGGIMYQVFPDRFARNGSPKGTVPLDRIMHSNTDEPPIWQPDKNGKIANNDYYGGNLRGIREKLAYLSSLGVTMLYINPIFEAHSNHRYNTADYMKIDVLLGDEKELTRLCEEAAGYGIRVILDGVFSHTGSDSIYFNREGRYGTGGAWNDAKSPYRPWYTFKKNEDGTLYKCWWGIDTLPEVNEDYPTYTEFITGEDGVVRHWLRTGVSGFRLDVADELPDSFIKHLRTALKSEKSDALLIGEVWEDATNKISHGGRREFLLGEELDGVMNYPFCDALVHFMQRGVAEELMETVVTVCENYPPPVLNTLMNHLGTHDTARILSRLSDEELENKPRAVQAAHILTGEKYAFARRLLMAAAVILYTLPGFPSIYYGDEAGMTGGSDPFNRAFYPWGKEDNTLLEFYKNLGRLRTSLSCLKDGRFVPVSAMLSCIAYARESADSCVLVIVNRNPHAISYNLPEKYKNGIELLTDADCSSSVPVPAYGAAIIRI